MPIGDERTLQGSEACTALMSHNTESFCHWNSTAAPGSSRTPLEISSGDDPERIPTAACSSVLSCNKKYPGYPQGAGVGCILGRDYSPNQNTGDNYTHCLLSEDKKEETVVEYESSLQNDNYHDVGAGTEPEEKVGRFDDGTSSQDSHPDGNIEHSKKKDRHTPFIAGKNNISSGTINNLTSILKEVTKSGRKRSKSSEDHISGAKPEHKGLRESVSLPAKEESSQINRDIWSAILSESSLRDDVRVASADQNLPSTYLQVNSTENGSQFPTALCKHDDGDKQEPLPKVADLHRECNVETEQNMGSTSDQRCHSPCEEFLKDEDEPYESLSLLTNSNGGLSPTRCRRGDDENKEGNHARVTMFLKKMEVAMKSLTVKSEPNRCSLPIPLATSLNASPEAMRSFIMDSDDELPDLVPEVKPEPINPLDDLIKCTCAATAGRTKIICLKCRLSCGEPPTKKTRTDRHFMDSLMELSNKDGNDRDSDSYDEDEEEEDSEYESDDKSTDSDCSLDSLDVRPQVGRKVNVTRREESMEQPTLRSVRVSSHELEALAEGRTLSTKSSVRPPYFPLPFHPRCPLGEGKSMLVRQFSEPQTGIVEAIIEETNYNNSMLFQVCSVIDSFTTDTSEPSNEVIVQLIRFLMESKDQRLTQKIYNFLQRNITCHPPLGSLPFKWTLIEEVVDNLRLPYGLKNLDHLTALNNILALQVMNSYIEAELLPRALSSQQRVVRSVAYKWLSIEHNYHNVRQVIKWITQALTFGEYDLCNVFIRLSISSTQEDSNDISFVPKLLPCLEYYLDLAISLSKCPEESARRISADLAHMLRCQPLSEQRQLFLGTLRSPLLKLKLCQQMLESLLEIDEHGSFTSLQDIVYTYYRMDPPRMSLTPPPTPSDSEDEGDPIREEKCDEKTWEEILLYLWNLTASYLEVEKGALKTTLWSRELNHITEVDLGQKDKRILSQLPTEITRLRQKISQQTKGLTPNLNSYLFKMECLADLAYI